MKRYKELFPLVHDFTNLELAYKKARKNKRYRQEVLKFSNNLEHNLILIQNDLINRRYRQGRYRLFTVLEPKKRLIAALPFRDRVAQHAINNIIEPLVDKRFYEHSYACRRGKGMHKASDTLYTWIRNLSFEGKEVYALKCDIHHYFRCIRHDILKKIIRRIFKDKLLLELLDMIIDSNGSDIGIPVGNLTSQLMANLFLDVLDKYVKEHLRVKYYIRYMDDFIILAHSQEELDIILKDIERFLMNELQLELNPKTTILNTKNGVDFCGYRHWSDHRKIRKSSVKRMKKKIVLYKRGKITSEEINTSTSSWLGHICHADTYNLRRSIMDKIAEINARATIQKSKAAV